MPKVPPLKPASALAEAARGRKLTIAQREPLWKGPEDPGPEGGVTQSLMSRFVVCPERFRVQYMLGLRSSDDFSAPSVFGNMWHACEEALAAKKDWRPALKVETQSVNKTYPMKKQQVAHWSGICSAVFPVYVDHWQHHPDVRGRTPLMQEESFSVPITLPSGRVVYCRGKFDAVDFIRMQGVTPGTYLQENKTKSTIDWAKLSRQLRFDLQTMFYLYVLTLMRDRGDKRLKGHPVIGVRYNVIRRSAHKQGKKETLGDFCTRVADLAKETPKGWFQRWTVAVSPHDLKKFVTEFLFPFLEKLCNWYQWQKTFMEVGRGKMTPFDCPFGHWRHPYGVYNVLADGGFADVDAYLETGSEVGMEPYKLFSELREPTQTCP